MAEYIKREDVLKAVTYVGTAEPTDIVPLTLLTAQKNIRRIPAADVVEVVRCKDCEHSSFVKSCSKYECRKGFGTLKFSNDFCSYGERKTQG